MKTVASLLAVVALSSVALAAPRGWKRFDGPAFQIFSPPAWKATSKAKLPSPDSALFTSPDGTARFSVYSPLWNGKPPEMTNDAKKEKVVSLRQSITKNANKNLIRTRWVTYATLDGRWTRAVVDHENVTLNTRYTFGFAYRDQKTYKRYLPLFENFKKSLQQFSD